MAAPSVARELDVEVSDPYSVEAPSSEIHAAEAQFLPLISRSSPYAYGTRSTMDVWWRFAYLLCSLFIVIGGLICSVETNPRYLSESSLAYLSNRRNCQPGGRLLLQPVPNGGGTLHSHVFQWVFASLLWSVCVGFGFIYFFQHNARVAVKLVALSPLITSVAVTLLYALLGIYGGAIATFTFTILVFFLYLGFRKDLPLCGKIFAISSTGLLHNPWLIGMITCIWLVWAMLMVPLGWFWVSSLGVGHVIPNPEIFTSPPEGAVIGLDGDSCTIDGFPVLCCLWDTNGWAFGYTVIVAIFTFWTAFLLMETRQFIIAGTLAQWYFTPASQPILADNMYRSVRHALGPQFGSLVAGASVLTLVEQCRDESCNPGGAAEGQPGGMSCLDVWCGCVAVTAADLVSSLTRFATSWAAIKGETLFHSGKQVTTLMRHNGLDAVKMWMFPSAMMNMAVVCISLLWAVMVLTFEMVSHVDQDTPDHGVLVSVGCFFVSYVVLRLFGSAVLNIADAVYVCYAMDKEEGVTTRADVHRAMDQLPLHKLDELPLAERTAQQEALAAAGIHPGVRLPAGSRREAEQENAYVPPRADSLERLEELEEGGLHQGKRGDRVNDTEEEWEDQPLAPKHNASRPPL